MGLIADILLTRTRWVYNGTAFPSWETVRFLSGFVLTNNEANRSLDLSVDPTAAGYVPSTRSVAGSLPIRINGGASATLAADITVSCNSASGAAAGSMSAAHFTLVNGATASPTASKLCLRGTTGEACAAWFATALTNIAGAGVLRCVAGDQTVIAIKGAANATCPILAVTGTGTKLLIGDSLELTDVEVDYYGGVFSVVDVPVAVKRIEVDAGSAEAIIFRPGPSAIETKITDGGIALAGADWTAEISGSDVFALYVCPDASTSPTVPLLRWLAPGGTLTIGGHTASTTTNVVIDAVTDVAIEVGGNKLVEAVAGRLGLYGVTPVSQGAAYTQTYSTVARTNAFAATSAYTGQDNVQIGSVYAKATDIEALRLEVLALAKLVNALIDDSQAVGIAL